jgi:hypothetical protein
MQMILKDYYSLNELSSLIRAPVLDVLYLLHKEKSPVYFRYCGYVRVINEPEESHITYNTSFLKIFNFHLEDFYFHLLGKRSGAFETFSFSANKSEYVGTRLITVSSDDLGYRPPPESFMKSRQAISIDNIFIMQTDIDLEYLTRSSVPEHKPLSTKERDNLYATIGVMARALADSKGTKYKVGDKVNVSQVTQLLIPKYIPDESTGLSERSLRERITKGLSLL